MLLDLRVSCPTGVSFGFVDGRTRDVQGNPSHIVREAVLITDLDGNGRPDAAIPIYSFLRGEGAVTTVIIAINDGGGAFRCKDAKTLPRGYRLDALQLDDAGVIVARTTSYDKSAVGHQNFAVFEAHNLGHRSARGTRTGPEHADSSTQSPGSVEERTTAADRASSASDGRAVTQNASGEEERSRESNVGAPPVADVPLLHPRDLLKNPFQFRGRTVVLDPASYPSVMNGAVLGWNPPVPSFAWAGLRFDRMLSENEALFEIMEVNVFGHTAGAPEFAGQLLVTADGESLQRSRDLTRLCS